MSKRNIIIFEGADKAGKSTAMNIVANKLTSNGIKITQYKFPQYNRHYGKFINSFLHLDRKVLLDEFCLSEYMRIQLTDKIETLDEILSHAAEENEYVFIDRCYYTYMVYDAVLLNYYILNKLVTNKLDKNRDTKITFAGAVVENDKDGGYLINGCDFIKSPVKIAETLKNVYDNLNVGDAHVRMIKSLSDITKHVFFDKTTGHKFMARIGAGGDRLGDDSVDNDSLFQEEVANAFNTLFRNEWSHGHMCNNFSNVFAIQLDNYLTLQTEVKVESVRDITRHIIRDFNTDLKERSLHELGDAVYDAFLRVLTNQYCDDIINFILY